MEWLLAILDHLLWGLTSIGDGRNRTLPSTLRSTSWSYRCSSRLTLAKASQSTATCTVTTEKRTASSMAVTKLSVKECCHGLRLVSCQKYSLQLNKSSTFLPVDSSKKKKAIARTLPASSSGTRWKSQIVSPWRHLSSARQPSSRSKTRPPKLPAPSRHWKTKASYAMSNSSSLTCNRSPKAS